jgi:Ni2+-binding GTPase involved in maturation of urease and hydrogenase
VVDIVVVVGAVVAGAVVVVVRVVDIVQADYNMAVVSVDTVAEDC